MKWQRQAIQAGSITLLLFAAVLFTLHYLHLPADFPNHSPWMDWAKYTDEGWYGDAAIRYYLRGGWRVPGDFNPGAALPVWPLLEALVFRFTGVGVVAARALAVTVLGGIGVCSYLLLSLRGTGDRTVSLGRLSGIAAVALLFSSPFVYAFGRMAILEPLLVLWTLCALLVASSVRHAVSNGSRTLRLVALGLLVALMVGTKTTAMFLLPALAWMLWSACRWQGRIMLRNTLVAAGAAALPAVAYLLLLKRHGLLPDVRYLFAANAYTAITRATFWSVLWQTLQDGAWIGTALYLATVAVVVVLCFRRAAWSDAVFTSLVLWAGGYLAYIAYHANLQPRYYLVVAVPLTLLLLRGAVHLAAWSRYTGMAAALVLAGVLVSDTWSTAQYIAHPEYTFRRAATQVESVVRAEPLHSHTVLSISGSNLSLMTGLPSICDDFGTMRLQDRIAAYRPGWFVTWNYVEDDKMEALSRFYRLTRMASMPAMDDPDRNLMILYRLDPRDGPVVKHHRQEEQHHPSTVWQSPA